MSESSQLSVLTVVEQFWHRVPGGVAVTTSNAIDALGERLQVSGVSAWHRKKTLATPSVFPKSWDGAAPIEKLKVPRRVLYEKWLAGKPPKVGSDSIDVLWASSMIVPTTDLPVVTTVNDIDFFTNPETLSKRGADFFPRAWERAIGASDVVVCPSNHVAEAVSDQMKADGATDIGVEVIPWAVNVPQDHTPQPELLSNLELKDKFFLWVGTLEPRKNLKSLTEAFLASEAEQLVVVGPAGWGEGVENVDPSRILFCGFVADDVLEELYRAAYAFVFPSIAEGFGLPLLEAMARGLPVICSNTSSMPEVVGEAAIQIDPLELDQITAAINKLDSSSELASEMATASKERASAYSWAQTAKGYEEVFRSVLS